MDGMSGGFATAGRRGMPVDVWAQLVPRHKALHEVFHRQAVLGRNAFGLLPFPDGLNAYAAAGGHGFCADSR